MIGIAGIQTVLQTIGIFGGLVAVLIGGYFAAKKLMRINAASEVQNLLEEKDRTIALNHQSIEALETRVGTLRTDVDLLTTELARSNRKMDEMATALKEAHDQYRQLEQYAAPALVPQMTEVVDGVRTRVDEVLDQVAIIAKRDFAIRNSQILEAITDGVLLVHLRSSNIEFANRAAEEMFGWGPDELLDKPLDILIPERLRTAHRAHRRLFAETPEKRLMGERWGELSGLKADGTEFPVQVGLAPLDKYRVVAVVRDATPMGRRVGDTEKDQPPAGPSLS